MRVVIITQSDPFYLGQSIEYLLKGMPEHCEVVGAVVFDVSPFGKKESFFKKVKKTYSIFGFSFLAYYTSRFIMNKLNPAKNVVRVLNKYGVQKIEIEKGVNHEDSLARIRSVNPDLLVSIAGNQIFRKPLIELAPKGCINLHTALLPKYRGLMPTFWVLKNNEKRTGVSVFFVDEGIDSGPIIVQKEVPINSQTQRELIMETKRIGMDCINEAIELIRDDNVQVIPNPNSEMTYFSFPTRADVTEFKKNGKRLF